ANGTPILASKAEVSVAQYFKHDAAQGAVVLAEGTNMKRLLLGISSVRVPYAPEFYVTSFLRRPEIDERNSDLELFWKEWRAGRFRRDLDEKYCVEYIVSERDVAGKRPSFHESTLFVYPVSALVEANATRVSAR